MTTHAREMLALRTGILDALTPADRTRLNIAGLNTPAEQAIRRGWTGTQLAAQLTAGIYTTDVRDPGAVMHARLVALAQTDPPTGATTPTPPPADRVFAHARGDQPAADPAGWAQRIREELKP